MTGFSIALSLPANLSAEMEEFGSLSDSKVMNGPLIRICGVMSWDRGSGFWFCDFLFLPDGKDFSGLSGKSPPIREAWWTERRGKLT